jgi:MFS transporter, DHA2 family, multidrug resistance protein
VSNRRKTRHLDVTTFPWQTAALRVAIFQLVGTQDVVEYGLRRGLIVVGVMAASLMQTLDSTIVNVALPTIQGNVGASQEEATWILTSYTIAAIIVIPLSPWLQNRFGRRNYFVVSILGFTLASVLCGASASLATLTFWRVVQGLFGGGLLATSQLILRDTFPREQLGVSQGIFTIGVIMGPALGPPIGGVLVDNWSWNWCFDINVAPGLFAAFILWRLLRDPSKAQAMPVDFTGIILLALALGSLQYVLTEGEQHYWLADPVNLFMTILCVASTAGFVGFELRFTKTPAVDLRVLAIRSVWAGTVLAFAIGAVLIGSTYVLPQFVQGSLGFTPTLSGLLILCRAIPVALCTPFVVALLSRMDARLVLFGGFAITGVGMLLNASLTTPQSSFWTFAFPLALTGIGGAAMFIPLSVAVLAATTPQDGQKAGAFVNLSSQLGGSVAVAMLGALIDRRDEFHSSILTGRLTLAEPSVRAFLHLHSLAQLGRLVYGQSVILSYADATWAIGFLALICIPLILLMRKRQEKTVMSQ